MISGAFSELNIYLRVNLSNSQNGAKPRHVNIFLWVTRSNWHLFILVDSLSAQYLHRPKDRNNILEVLLR